MISFVAYYRVSTDKQGIKGLGMDAQREAVSRFIAARGQLAGEFIEVESGKRHSNRPQLLAALDVCRRRPAVLLIARLDRLARNVAFISNLMESDVEFVAVDMPEAGKLTIHVLAAVAEHERELISKRTKDALAIAKGRGQQLGNPRYEESIATARAAKGIQPPAPQVLALMRERRGQGRSYREIARELNRLNIRTPQGSEWYASTIRGQIMAVDKTDDRYMSEEQKIAYIVSEDKRLRQLGINPDAPQSDIFFELERRVAEADERDRQAEAAKADRAAERKETFT